MITFNEATKNLEHSYYNFVYDNRARKLVITFDKDKGFVSATPSAVAVTVLPSRLELLLPVVMAELNDDLIQKCTECYQVSLPPLSSGKYNVAKAFIRASLHNTAIDEFCDVSLWKAVQFYIERRKHDLEHLCQVCLGNEPLNELSMFSCVFRYEYIKAFKGIKNIAGFV